jgi:hypothetical protein
MKNLLITKTAILNLNTEKWTPSRRFNVNERINFRAFGVGHIEEYYQYPCNVVLTRFERWERWCQGSDGIDY